MFRRATLSSAASFGGMSVLAATRSVVSHPVPSSSDKQHALHCPRQRVAGLDVNKLSYIDEAAKPLPNEWKNPIENATWDLNEAKKVEVNHKPTDGMVDAVAYYTVQALRFAFDLFAGFKFGRINESKFINRCVFLETVAGVPGMVGGMLRHMNSLRKMQRDHGWIHTLLEEAENERMHLLTFLEMKKPSFIFRCTVLLAQGIFFNFFMLAYLISPRFCHRLVGYIEEEAVKTYTHMLHSIDSNELPMFALAKCPPLAINYWKLSKDATFRDLILAIRADEAGHRLVNHTFADMHAANMQDETNPFIVHHVNKMQDPAYMNAQEGNESEAVEEKKELNGAQNTTVSEVPANA